MLGGSSLADFGPEQRRARRTDAVRSRDLNDVRQRDNPERSTLPFFSPNNYCGLYFASEVIPSHFSFLNTIHICAVFHFFLAPECFPCPLLGESPTAPEPTCLMNMDSRSRLRASLLADALPHRSRIGCPRRGSSFSSSSSVTLVRRCIVRRLLLFLFKVA